MTDNGRKSVSRLQKKRLLEFFFKFVCTAYPEGIWWPWRQVIRARDARLGWWGEVPSWVFKHGPDILGIYGGRIVAITLRWTISRTKAEHYTTLRRLVRYGAVCIAADTPDDIISVLGGPDR